MIGPDEIYRDGELAALLREAGLAAEQWLGDWDGNSFDVQESAEIIVVGGRADR